ncbi:MAG: serine hydrolase [Ignavibacteriales bacterium]|nr:serine hydrolase [Ignavibacteriales bacterium]
MKISPNLFPIFIFFFLLLILIQGCAPVSSVKPMSENEWIGSTLNRLTLREKISQMIMSRAYGYYYSDRSDEFKRIERLVKEQKVGGLIFFQGDVYETATLINRFQEMSHVPLLIGADFEWGSAMRIRRGTRFPEAMAIGVTQDGALAFKVGEAIGKESRALGVHQVFAPVADVNNNPNNPVINTRSFGENQYLVADMASAFAKGLESGGVIATAKHFPGHGDTQTDSHLDLPFIDKTETRLDSIELFPFRQLINQGISSIMVAHLEVPSLESKKIPATLSSSIITGHLKKELGFQGLVVTDALDMGAIVNRFTPDSAAVKAVEAGVDILLVLPDEEKAIDAIENAVKKGTISEARINESARKILKYKWSMGLSVNRLVDLKKIPEIIATPDHLALSSQVARNSITVLKNDSILPLERFGEKRILEVVLSDADNYRTEIHRSSTTSPNEAVGDYFTAQLKKRYSNLQTVKINPSGDSLDYNSVFKKANDADLIICPVFSKARSGSGSFGFSPDLIGVVDSLNKLGKPLVLIALGSPYVVGAFPNADAIICTYSDCEVSTEAVNEALFGEIPTKGKLPVTIPDLFSYGSGINLSQSILRKDIPENVGMIRDSLARLDSIMTDAIQNHAFPGGQLLVAKDGAVVYNKSFGSFEFNSKSAKVSASTVYDIASVTKVIATTSAIMRLYDEEKIRLDDLVMKYIPEFGNNGKEKITIRNLLLHNGGLPAFKRLFLTCKSPEEVLDSVYQTETIYPTGDSTIYSDFDFILLGKIVEKISGVTLDKYVDSVFFKPLGMTSTIYNPPSSIWRKITPTEYDSVYRKRLIQGEVHDENAFALGGISGHSGLFSTATDLSIFLQMIMNGGNYGGKQLLKPETIKLFTARHGKQSTRALGWDTKTMNGYSSAGTLFGEKSFGHTGFTGTSVWVEPEKNIFVILLTNRVYPTRNNPKIMQIRPKVHDTVMKSIY